MRNYLPYILFIFFIGISICSECTDPNACNYNPDATVDDGSCYYPLECPNNSLECNVESCSVPEGFDWEVQSNLFFLFVDYAYKFNSAFPLEPHEDWIGGFKSFDETQEGTCDIISDECPDVNSDGLLTDNVEFCVGSIYWNGPNDSEIPLMGFDGDPLGYLEPGDKPYFKLFDSDTDSIYFMLPYKNGQEFEVEYSGNSQIEIMQIDSLVAQCPFYNNYDTDDDNIPDTCDACPNDSDNDIDGDGICGNIDICPNDYNNDIDGDGICGDVDLCPNDSDNDIDGDGICGDIDLCPNDYNNFDIDNDQICDDIDDCVGEYDECGICNGDGTWCLDANISIGLVYVQSENQIVVEILYDSPLSIGGFQFTISGATILSTANGAAANAGFNIAHNDNTLVAFSLNGDSISPGSGLLTNLYIEINESEICINDFVLSDNDGDEINVLLGPCKLLPCIDNDNDSLCNYEDNCPNDADNDIDEDGICGDVDLCPNDADNDIDEDGICGDVDEYPDCYENFYDCFGICGGDAIVDDCGICDGNNYDYCDFDNDGIINIKDICPDDYNNDIDGDGICGDIDEYPDCYENFYDCFGICGGDAIVDDCGICDGTGNCECPGYDDNVIPDCNGDCDGEAIIDNCGICSDGNTDLESNADQDCNGDCFGNAFIDDCGVCSSGETGHMPNSDIDDCGICFGNNEDIDCNGICFGDGIIDDCGICDGNNEIMDCNGDCDGEAIIDNCGICSDGNTDLESNADQDCNGDCFGNAFIDDCGVCSSGETGHMPNSDIDDCGICFGNNEDIDCNGICFGDGIDVDEDNICDDIDDCIGQYDECGICNGDGTWCLEGIISFGNLTETHLDILYDSPLDIGGFQFSLSGLSIINAFGGASADYGFNIANSSYTVLAFSLTNNVIPSGSGLLLTLTIEYAAPEACFDNVVFSDIDGDEINMIIDECIQIPCENEDLDNICDNIDDCFGSVDDCGVCNGNSDTCLGCTDILACNYDETAIIDDDSCTYSEGSCDCYSNPTDQYCDCSYNIEDCWGDCGGTAYIDYCGDCVGGNSPYEEGFFNLGCGCNNPAPLIYCEDTDGDSLGDYDSQNLYCLEESEYNEYDVLPDYGWVEDCSDQCPDDFENDQDQDGICESDEIFGCNDNLACNYDELVTEDDGSCIYIETINLLPINNEEFLIDNSNVNDSLQFVWTSSDNECGFVNYRLSIFDNTLAPILIRFTSDTNFTIPFESLNLEESLISNYYWNIYSTNNQELSFESDLFNFIINTEYLNSDFYNIPIDFSLSPAYPNPFNPQTTFDYAVPYYSNLIINIYNSIGQIIDTPINRFHSSGFYSFSWNPIDVSSGVYYIQLISEDVIINRKIMYIK